MTRTLDKTHTLLSYVEGSLKNAVVMNENVKENGFIFSLINPPVPLGGNIVSLDIYVDELPISKKSIQIATSDTIVNASVLSETRPIQFKPFQSARFLVVGMELESQKKHKITIMSKLEGFEQIIIPFTFRDFIGNKKEKVIISSNLPEESDTQTFGDTMFMNFASPLILSGRKAYIVCSSNGALSANWTWMGARYDNGGLYVPPARAFGRIIVEISVDEGVRKRLPNFVMSSRHENGSLCTHHEVAGIHVKRTLFVPIENKGFIQILNFDSEKNNEVFTGDKKKPLTKKIRVHFLIDGNITSYGLAAISQSNFSRYYKSENCLQIRTIAKKGVAHYFGTIGISPKNLKPSKILTDSFDNDLELSYDVELEEGLTKEIALIGTGDFTTAQDCLNEYKNMRDNYLKLFEDTKNHHNHISQSTFTIHHASSSSISNSVIVKLAKALKKAKTGLEYLKANYDNLGEGISAGLPRFPNYWARDTGWSLRGYLSMGQYDFSLRVIDNFLKRQAKHSHNGAVKGELPMVISGRTFLHNTTYGSADSTFLFPWAIREYVHGTGNTVYLTKRWESIVDLVNSGFLKDIDNDDLIEHGFTGTAEKLPIQDSTWMDHIDRRKSANDVQALFYESLMIGSDLAKIVEDKEHEKIWFSAAQKLRNKIDREYWEPKLGFYYDTIRKDLTKDESIRPNSLVILLTEAVSDQHKARLVLERLEKDDMTTSWGIRSLSSLDPKYHPSLYHDGAVWPLITGWAAISEIKNQRTQQALEYLSIMADRIISENGMFAETYRGDRPEPFNSCILQAWSVGLYVYALRELMLGIKPNMIKNNICLEPKLPDSIRSDHNNLNFDHFISTNEGLNKISISVRPDRERITIIPERDDVKLPEFSSTTYSIDIQKNKLN
jgi:glycogen debranching enzyme